MPTLDSLPVIVTGPGNYKTRDGQKVVVHEVKPGSTFSVKGSRVSQTKTGRDKLRYEIWHPSGRADVFEEKGKDIVSVFNYDPEIEAILDSKGL